MILANNLYFYINLTKTNCNFIGKYKKIVEMSENHNNLGTIEEALVMILNANPQVSTADWKKLVSKAWEKSRHYPLRKQNEWNVFVQRNYPEAQRLVKSYDSSKPSNSEVLKALSRMYRQVPLQPNQAYGTSEDNIKYAWNSSNPSDGSGASSSTSNAANTSNWYESSEYSVPPATAGPSVPPAGPSVPPATAGPSVTPATAGPSGPSGNTMSWQEFIAKHHADVSKRKGSVNSKFIMRELSKMWVEYKKENGI